MNRFEISDEIKFVKDPAILELPFEHCKKLTFVVAKVDVDSRGVPCYLVYESKLDFPKMIWCSEEDVEAV